MRNKGQLMGLPLVLIFALVVGAMILFFGARWVMDLGSQADYVSMLDSIRDIENNIDTFGNYDEGSAKVYELELPTKVEKLCFYDSEQAFNCVDDGNPCSQEVADTMQLVTDSSNNLYLYPLGLFDKEKFGIEHFQPEAGNPECVSNGESILITAYKDYVGITYYEQ
jgi:hypothetical protein